jgi:hypothetical protein
MGDLSLPGSRYKDVLAELRSLNIASVNDGTDVGNVSVSMEGLKFESSRARH